MTKTVLVSGGFDPPHTGHCHLLLGAVMYGKIIIALNSDDWLIRKKGYRLMPWIDRANVMLSFKNVADVIKVDDSDDTICEALRRIRPDYFANGGDRSKADPREHAVCKEFGIEELFKVGGEKKMQSSSALVHKLLDWSHGLGDSF